MKLDFKDNRAGSNLKILLNKSIFLNGKVCRTLPWINQNSTPQCTQCLRWGHSRASCQTNLSYCAICSGCHMTSDHQNSRLQGETSKYTLACINCLAAGLTHTHRATDRLCPFYMERNNKCNITALLATIREWRLEGFENPFDYDPRKRPVVMGQYPTQFLAGPAVVSSQDSDPSFRMASSNDSLFRHVPNITASQAAAATIEEIQDTNTAL